MFSLEKHMEEGSPLEWLSLFGLQLGGKCMTIDNIKKRKVWILNWCYMCECNSESVDHLFLHCLVAMDLWSMVLGLFGVSWVIPKSVVGLLADRKSTRLNSSHRP